MPGLSAGATIVVGELSHDAGEQAAWQAFVAGHPDATIYHDLAWRTIFGEALGYRAHYLMAREAGGAVAGVLPLFRVPSLAGRPRLVSVPFRDRGGILTDSAEAFAALAEAAAGLRAATGSGFVEIKSLTPYPQPMAESVGLVRRDYWVHSAAQLPGDVAELDRRLGPKRRNMIQQARKAGLVASRLGEADDPVGVWYAIYLRSQRHLGVPPFPRRFFQTMFALLANKRALQVWVTRDAGGVPLASCVVFREAGRAIYAYSASLPEARAQRPSDLMIHAVASDCIGAGIATFDMGADSPDQDGLLFFKRGWLCTQQPIPFYYIGGGGPAARDSSAPQFSAARNVLRRLPLAVSRHVLSRATRYFG